MGTRSMRILTFIKINGITIYFTFMFEWVSLDYSMRSPSFHVGITISGIPFFLIGIAHHFPLERIARTRH